MDLTKEHCQDLPKGTPALGAEEATALAAMLDDGWEIDGDVLLRRFQTRNFATALEVVTAVGDIAEAQNHHPDIAFGWGYAELRFTTHSVGGLSRNDFICAARIDAAGIGG